MSRLLIYQIHLCYVSNYWCDECKFWPWNFLGFSLNIFNLWLIESTNAEPEEADSRFWLTVDGPLLLVFRWVLRSQKTHWTTVTES